jgi:hypothetical protein
MAKILKKGLYSLIQKGATPLAEQAAGSAPGMLTSCAENQGGGAARSENVSAIDVDDDLGHLGQQ